MPESVYKVHLTETDKRLILQALNNNPGLWTWNKEDLNRVQLLTNWLATLKPVKRCSEDTEDLTPR